MYIVYQIKKALKLIGSFDTREDRLTLRRICGSIQRAEDSLVHKAEPLFNDCMRTCKGMCCRNIHIDSIITLLDFVFILGLKPELADELIARTPESSLFAADCRFLHNGVGPCLFPADLKPERCILTFCGDTRSVARELKVVRARFSKLNRYIALRRPVLWFGF